MGEGIDKTKLSRVRHVLDSLERHNPLETDPDVTFEFLMAGCFPQIWKNVQQKLSDEHMAGYLEGLEASKNLKED